MNMTLIRSAWKSDGVLGQLYAEDGSIFCDSLERAYLVNGDWTPKVPAGTYVCKRRRSPHFGYDVFQLIDVPNCTYIEIHIANTEADLDGCIGLGESFGVLNGLDAVLKSAHAFNRFMQTQSGIDEFQLTIV